MFVGARQLGASPFEAEDVGQFQELIELQKQIVRIAEQNAATQQRCELLRRQLERELEVIAAPRRAFRERLRDIATGMFGRRLTRPEQAWESKRP
jgi:hypothetical protein